MIKKINKTESFIAVKRREGKVTTLDKKEHIEAIVAMNGKLESFRREYQVKDRNSQRSAAKLVLTC